MSKVSNFSWSSTIDREIFGQTLGQEVKMKPATQTSPRIDSREKGLPS